MFQSFKRKLQDVRTLASLCTQAEHLALQQGRSKPGSEHFVLAALDLPDQTARQAFERLGIDADAFRNALAGQRSDALAAVGIVTPEAALAPPSPQSNKPKLYEAEPSGQRLVQQLAETRKERQARGLFSADILLAAAQERYTTTSRAFQWLGITTEQLTESATWAISSNTANAAV